jgi:hypothetical protein
VDGGRSNDRLTILKGLYFGMEIGVQREFIKQNQSVMAFTKLKTVPLWKVDGAVSFP